MQPLDRARTEHGPARALSPAVSSNPVASGIPSTTSPAGTARGQSVRALV